MVCRAADRLGHLCVALHLTPQQFAESIGLPLHQTTRILHPTRAPSRPLAARVLRTFPQVDPAWLLCGQGEMFLPTKQGNYLAVNYGHCTQIVAPMSYYDSTLSSMQAHLVEKERTIQILMRQIS
ncbi:MAG: hypothetical protein EOO60_02355 [Hymenobacter sp.]|nr:MAG: hypothetical protein EOO60_02355 [Hymenobacter sp.]